MKKKIFVATKNKGKIKELKKIFSNLDSEIIFDIPDIPDIKEDGNSFEENAIKKSKHLFELTNQPSIADDSGLEIDYLNGVPGINSSRFAGQTTPYNIKNEKIINIMKNTNENKRTAQFRCVIAYTDEIGTKTFEGICKGKIADKMYGSQGFGYDPIFIPKGYNKTFGELDENIKNKISHRAKALKKFYNWYIKNK